MTEPRFLGPQPRLEAGRSTSVGAPSPTSVATSQLAERCLCTGCGRWWLVTDVANADMCPACGTPRTEGR